jgi:branched-chain amino acid aminotransferase
MDIANLNQNILIYVNGELLPRSEAVISVYDSGFLMGDGVWEGIRLIQDKWIFLDEHIDRLFEGARAIDLELGLSAEQITNAILETQHANNMSDQAHARVMFTRGVKVKPFQQPALSTSGPTFVIIMEHSDPHAKAQGITMATVPQIRGMPMSQDPKLNSHSKLNCILACIQANKMGADEALMLDPHGFVNTTNSCNFFIVKNGEVWTSTGDYCMNGITRKKIIMLCKDNSIPVFEKNFSLVDVYSADEVFITGTLGSLVPVLELDKRTFDAKNNKLTQTLQSLYNDLINSQ